MHAFNPTSPQPVRAVQAWLILIGLAHNRQTITYSGLAELMYHRQAAGVLAQILGKIACYCGENNLPQLNALVVGRRRGTPGHDIPLDAADIDAMREKIYEHDWYDVQPPSSDDFMRQV